MRTLVRPLSILISCINALAFSLRHTRTAVSYIWVTFFGMKKMRVVGPKFEALSLGKFVCDNFDRDLYKRVLKIVCDAFVCVKVNECITNRFVGN